MKKWIAAGLAAFILAGSLVCGGWNAQAMSREALEAEAKQGNAQAMADLGELYLENGDVAFATAEERFLFNHDEKERSDPEGFLHGDFLSAMGRYWINRSARAGNLQAQYDLLFLYTEGMHVSQNGILAKALTLTLVPEVQKKAEAGDARCQSILGSMYTEGIGLAKDIEQGRKWFLKASEQGDIEASYLLSQIYLKDPTMRAQGQTLLEKAAKGGSRRAQKEIGLAYLEGNDGFPVDLTKAGYWLGEAIKQGDHFAAMMFASKNLKSDTLHVKVARLGKLSDE